MRSEPLWVSRAAPQDDTPDPNFMNPSRPQATARTAYVYAIHLMERRPYVRTPAVTCLMSLAVGAVATSADAKTIFERATYTGVDTGEYSVSDTRYFGVAFTLDQTTEITAIGGQFGGFPGGTIFGAIVSLPPETSFPDFTPSTIKANSLDHVVFAAPSDTTDLTEKLDVTLGAGTYGVVFGSGRFRRGRLRWTGRWQQFSRVAELLHLFRVWRGQKFLGSRFDGRCQNHRLRRT